MSWRKRLLGLLALLGLVWLALSWWWSQPVAVPDTPLSTDASVVQRGAYLARAGNCMACHTAPGAVPYAGGRGIETPFGMLYSSNLTPDRQTGLGQWRNSDFWRALHHGQSRDGRLLYPAFPYTNTTLVTREDADALFAFLQTLPPVTQPNMRHTVAWPVNTQLALGLWQALFFKPGSYQAEPTQTAEWNRGAYLIKGLGHCSACHTARNALGATRDALDLAGGLIPLQNWYAPSLTDPAEAGVANWTQDEVLSLLKHGVTELPDQVASLPGSPAGASAGAVARQRAWVSGPMGEVVQGSTQYLSEPDLRAMAVFLQSLPPSRASEASAVVQSRQFGLSSAKMGQGQAMYEQHCQACHGEQGQGRAGAYPTLAGNRAVQLRNTANLVQMLLYGGYSPATQGNPRPYGMPPFVLQLKDSEIAAILTYVRNSWGNQAAEVTEVDVNRHRNPPGL